MKTTPPLPARRPGTPTAARAPLSPGQATARGRRVRPGTSRRLPCLPLAVVTLVAVAAPAGAALEITEFLARPAGEGGLVDGDGDQPDWVELHNPGPGAVDLAGYRLGDEPGAAGAWVFPARVLAEGAYLVVFASGKDRPVAGAGAELHTDFRLDGGGGHIALADVGGEVISSFTYPEQRAGISYGKPSGSAPGNGRYFVVPSPGERNPSTGILGYVGDTRFSVDRGFFDAAFDLEITTATKGADIYYTTDGQGPKPGTILSPPTGTRYTGPVRIGATTVLRAIAIKAGFEPSNVDTQTYLFPADIIRQPDRPDGFPDAWRGGGTDYAMDPDVIDNPAYAGLAEDALLGLPAISVATPIESLFGPEGIYDFATQSGEDWERPVSAELIYADGREGFQVDAGFRAQGGASRNADRSPKHSFSLRFRSQYGPGRLDFPLFPGSPVRRFNSLHLRAMYNNSWIHRDGGQRGRATMIRDQWMRDSLLEMGQPDALRGGFCHLFLNGVYWGVYNFHERPDAAHYVAYRGGDEDGVEPINGGSGSNGTARYNAMRSAVNRRDWAEIQTVLDVDNYIDWVIIERFGSNQDLKNNGNWRAAGGAPGTPWVFYSWDSERVLEGVATTGTQPAADPPNLLSSLDDIETFRVRFGDRVHRHLFNGGALTPERNQARWDRRAEELEVGIVAESARWGDHRRSTPYTRNVEWRAENRRLAESYFPQRTDVVISYFERIGLYPDLRAPRLSQHGGPVGPDFRLVMSSPDFGSILSPGGEIFYTADGPDPRREDGSLHPDALDYGTPFELGVTGPLTLRARLRKDGEWSALTEAVFSVATTPAAAGNLAVTEIAYNPAGPDDAEFIELKNTGGTAVDLTGVRLADAVIFTFGPLSLAPGEHVVVVEDEAAFAARYSDPDSPYFAAAIKVAGAWTGALANGGESLTVAGAGGEIIQSFTYGDGGRWPGRADGGGSSLQVLDPGGDPADPDNWRPSTEYFGSPGRDGAPPRGDVVINEVLANAPAPPGDRIELHNTTADEAEVGGWFLSDSTGNLAKYRIPDGVTVPPGGYLVFDETEFNPTPASPAPNHFALGAGGDAVYLVEADAGGNLLAVVDAEDFGASAPGVAFGRVVTSEGEERFTAQSAPSFGAANPGPARPAVVISEFLYRNASGGAAEDEFVEVANPGAEAVDLFRPGQPDLTWQVEGIFADESRSAPYAFPEGIRLRPGEAIALVNTDPIAFRSRHGLPPGTPVLGPFFGGLDNAGERLSLRRPGDDLTGGTTPYITVDTVRYKNRAPWPVPAVGGSLQRLLPAAFGDEPGAWAASENPGGTPGSIPGGGGTTATEDALLASYFTAAERADPLVGGPGADPDGDGVPNRVELVTGTDPTDPSSRRGAGATIALGGAGSPGGDALALTFHRRRGTDLEVRVEVSSDLLTWRSGPGHTSEDPPVDAGDGTEQVTVRDLTPAGGARSRYLRLVVRRR